MIGPEKKKAVKIKQDILKRLKNDFERKLKLFEEEITSIWWLKNQTNELEDMIEQLEEIDQVRFKKSVMEKEIEFNFNLDDFNVIHGESKNGVWLWNTRKGHIASAFNVNSGKGESLRVAEETHDEIARIAYAQHIEFLRNHSD